MLNAGDKEQFELILREHGKTIKTQKLFDPFHHTTIKMKAGFKNAWKVLWYGIDYAVMINGTREADEVIFTGDYTPQAAMQKAEPKEEEFTQTTTYEDQE